MIRKEDRKKIGSVPAAIRTVEMGPLEGQYARLALDLKSSGLVLGGVTVNNCQLVQRQLPTALLVLQKRHPILRCRINRRSTHEFVYEEDPSLVLPISTSPRLEGEDTWLTVWRTHFEGLVTPLHAPSLFVHLVTSSTSCEILLALNHYACDGTSLSFLMHELLTYIGNQTQVQDVPWGEWEIPADEAPVLRERYRAPLSYWFHNVKTVAQYIRPMMSQQIVSLPFAKAHEGLQLFRTVDQLIDDSRTYHRMVQFSRTPQLLDLCRKNQCTVTSAASAAFLCAQADAIQAKTATSNNGGLIFAMVMSTRSALNSVESNLSPHVGSMGKSVFPMTPGRPFSSYTPQDMWALAREIKEWSSSSASPDEKLFYAKHTTSFMWNNPTGPNFVRYPNFVVSSWGSNAVQTQYGTELFVERGVFAQNSRHVSIPMLSMNNMVKGTIVLVLLAPTRFDVDLLDTMFMRGVQRLESMVDGEEQQHAKL